jgi:hypothetical protein
MKKIYIVLLCLFQILFFLEKILAQTEEFVCPVIDASNNTEYISATITLKILLVEFPDVRHRTSPFAYTKTHFEELLVSHGVLSPWSDSRNPWCPPNSCVFVPNTRCSSNVGMEILEVNDFQGYILVKLYANNPEDAPPSNISGGGAKPPSTYSWVDYDICGAGSGGGRIYYTVSAVDNTNLESVQANHDWIPWQMVFCKDKPGYEAIAISEYKLYSNFPNPFNPLTTIQYDIKEAGLVHIKVYDILGTEMTELVNEFKEKGKHFITFHASNLPSGVYIYSI